MSNVAYSSILYQLHVGELTFVPENNDTSVITAGAWIKKHIRPNEKVWIEILLEEGEDDGKDE